MFTTGHGNRRYYDEYITILGRVYGDTDFKFVQMIDIDGTLNTYDTVDELCSIIFNYDKLICEQKKIKKLVVFTNKEFLKFLPTEVEHIEYRCYNKILTDYSTYVPDPSILTKEWNAEVLTSVHNQLAYWASNLKYIGQVVDGFIDKEDNKIETSCAFLIRRIWDIVYEKEVKKLSCINTDRAPQDYKNFIYTYCQDIMKYNSNMIIQHEAPEDKIYYNVIKADINSSFWHKYFAIFTGGRPHKVDLDNIKIPMDTWKRQNMCRDKIWFATIKFNKILECNHFIDIFEYAEVNIRNPIRICQAQWEILEDYYNITTDDVDVIDFWSCNKMKFRPEIQTIIKDIHNKKAIAKSNHNEQERKLYKLMGHTNHGSANQKHIIQQFNIAGYNNLWFERGYNNTDRALTPQDGLFLYSYAAISLLKLTSKLTRDNVFNFDTDMVVIPEEYEYIIDEYNKDIKKGYKRMGVNINDVTADGHTIGFLEVEDRLDAHYFLGPKMYFYVKKGSNKLSSTTAGYPKNRLGELIEQTSGLKGVEALEWFAEQEDVIFGCKELGWIYDGTDGKVKPCMFSKKMYKKTDYV